MLDRIRELARRISWFKELGPGVITGAADDDPSGIATYSQAGAQFGFDMLWTVIFTYPFMVSIQMVSAQIGRVTGKGLAVNIREHYHRYLLYLIVGLLIIANTLNIAADISAMGGALKLIIGGSAHAYAVFFGVLSIVLEVFLSYSRYVQVLKWLTLALFAYVGVVFAVQINWNQVLIGTAFPHVSLKSEFITTVVALFGTTISPYLFFWQASQEVEEQQADPNAHALKDAPEEAGKNLHRIKVDTILGMGFSNLIAFFIILTTALTLHAHGVTDIQTAEQAASALKPIAGNLAFFLFGMGIIGTGLLAIPVLAGSSAYAMAESFQWKGSLDAKPQAAGKFYLIITISTLIGIALGFTRMDPMKGLFWSAVINGVVSVPMMFLMMRMAVRRDIMGQFVLRPRLKILGWLATLVMLIAVAMMFCTLIFS